jgi:hypothetical protein
VKGIWWKMSAGQTEKAIKNRQPGTWIWRLWKVTRDVCELIGQNEEFLKIAELGRKESLKRKHLLIEEAAGGDRKSGVAREDVDYDLIIVIYRPELKLKHRRLYVHTITKQRILVKSNPDAVALKWLGERMNQ